MINKVNHTKMLKSGVALCVALGTVLLTANDSYALGFLIPNQDAFAIGRGNAFAATADNPSAIYYNPAGITQIPNNDLQIGDLNYLGLNVEYHSPIGAEANTKFEVIPIPQLFYTPDTHEPGAAVFVWFGRVRAVRAGCEVAGKFHHASPGHRFEIVLFHGQPGSGVQAS